MLDGRDTHAIVDGHMDSHFLGGVRDKTASRRKIKPFERWLSQGGRQRCDGDVERQGGSGCKYGLPSMTVAVTFNPTYPISEAFEPNKGVVKESSSLF